MRRLSVPILIVSLLFVQSRCATGLEPPRPTQLVEVTEGLTFTFGQEEICWNIDDMDTSGKPPGDCEKGQEIPFIPPTTLVQLSPFAIDQHEVSNIQYEYCVSLGACTAPTGYNAPGDRQREYYEIDEFDDYPVMFVRKFQAQEYCTFVGRRLPTEIEWDRVARGNPDEFDGGKRSIPSDGFDSLATCAQANVAGEYCNDGNADTVAVDQPGDDYVWEGGQKIYHLFSNVSEWTGDAYDVLRTCKDDLPPGCSSIFECGNLIDDPDWDDDRDENDPDYKTWEEAHPRTICQQNAQICGGCDSLDATEEVCHEGCADEPRNYFTCVTWSGNALPVDASALKTGGGSYGVVRGGSVVTTENRSCHFMSDYRGSTTRKEADSSASGLGFRCAVDL